MNPANVSKLDLLSGVISSNDWRCFVKYARHVYAGWVFVLFCPHFCPWLPLEKALECYTFSDGHCCCIAAPSATTAFQWWRRWLAMLAGRTQSLLTQPSMISSWWANVFQSRSQLYSRKLKVMFPLFLFERPCNSFLVDANSAGFSALRTCICLKRYYKNVFHGTQACRSSPLLSMSWVPTKGFRPNTILLMRPFSGLTSLRGVNVHFQMRWQGKSCVKCAWIRLLSNTFDLCRQKTKIENVNNDGVW